MPSLEEIRTSIESIGHLGTVVRTMKALAMVSIRRYEAALVSIGGYAGTIELGLQAVLQQPSFGLEADHAASLSGALAPAPLASGGDLILFGSDHGLCGAFNERIIDSAQDGWKASGEHCRMAAIGLRLASGLEARGLPLEATYSQVNSLEGVTGLIQDLLLLIDHWREAARPEAAGKGQVLLLYHRVSEGLAHEPVLIPLLPVDPGWLRDLGQRPWHSSSLPLLPGGSQEVAAALIRQHLFVCLVRACVESLVSESSARLVAMQGSEKHIEDRLGTLTTSYRQQRQSEITEELLDIVAGFEALHDDLRTSR